MRAKFTDAIAEELREEQALSRDRLMFTDKLPTREELEKQSQEKAGYLQRRAVMLLVDLPG